MTYTIALAGKGGTGKTTIGAMLVRYLVENDRTPVLAVDADSNANFNEVLGLDVRTTLGEAREQMKSGGVTGMTKDVFMEMKTQEAVIEANGFDLIVMGRPEGPGCYCAANTLLTQILDKLIGNYRYAVIDNEAGMEHISRLTTSNVDLLLIASDPSRRGIQAAKRIMELTSELRLEIGRKCVIVNQVRRGEEQAVEKAIQGYGMELAGLLPIDEEIQELDFKGSPTYELSRSSLALKSAYEIFERII